MTIRQRAGATSGESGVAPRAPAPAAGQPCGSLARVLARIYREGRPEILVVGPLCGQTVVYLAERGARVHVDAFEPPAAPLARDDAAEPTPFRIEQPDESFDLVLAWEHIDFIPPELLPEFGRELGRLLRRGGWLFLLSQMKPSPGPERLSRFRLLADDLIAREATAGPARRRFVHSTRDVERALAGFSIQGVHLQRNQVREFSALKL